MAKDALKMSGKIIKMHSTQNYDVLLENGITIKATISGKMSFHNIRMIPGDHVDVELSPYEMTKGRIVFRHK
ncbi:translation initiation factor IF-1 [[Mycoplasma] phocae]|uniref:Translation initiation factor IF-1 n=3 Tax=Mycoplasmatota TaxID=544448 RepID=A0A2Z5IQX0_9BACT|nr:translation initiation factor IF-1 [Mycoplasma phocoeninasale]AXE60636.1 translation initiation factor IF-1 [[Mycoplasma] phocae]MBN0970730.1 translation initiation factor IF-1 [Mycoplasma phocoeninasale]QJG66162.1 translation initiation factor IF-1 [Mycoplasma phocoeninasale]